MSRKKGTPPIILDVAFKGDDSLTANDLKRLVVPNFKDAPKTLIEDYEKTPIVYVGMALTEDNTRIESSTALTGGVLRGASVNASKIWKFAEHEVQLNFSPIDLSLFEYDGKLCSQLVDSSELDYELNCATATTEDLKALGFSGFTVRVFLTPTTGHNCQIVIVIYPEERTELESAQSLVDRPVFPGIQVGGKFDVELGFNYRQIVDKAIGSPILPCIVTKEPIKSTSEIPSREEFLDKIASTLRAVVAPEIKQNGRTLAAAWAAIKDKGEAQLSKAVPTPLWPEFEPVANPTGNKKKFFFLYRLSTTY